MKRLREVNFIDHPYDDSMEAQDVDPASIINHPLETPEELFRKHEYMETDEDRRADPHIRAM